jgi:Zn-dependent peptidase ImmA (M78 family)
MDKPASIADPSEWSVHRHVDADQAEIEALAERVYRDVGAAPGDVWLPSRIAEALGIEVVRSSAARMRGAYERSTRTITIQSSLTLPIAEWTLGHEIGHDQGLVHERACDLFGACLQMRRGPFLAALHEHGEAWHELAALFTVTSTSAALRAAELQGTPLAVVLPGRGIYSRNIHADRETIRRLARTGGPGIRRAPLVDAPDRVVMIAETEETG